MEESQEEEQVVEETEPRHRAPEVGHRERQEDERTQPDSGCSGESGEDASMSGAEVETAVEALRKWLRDNPMDGLTTVQCGAHLLLQVVKSGTAFGKYVRRMVEPHEEEEQERQRSVLPLPLKEDSLNELKKIIASGEYRRLAGTWKEKQNMGASKTKKEMRKSGLLIWHGLMTAALNFLWSGGRSQGRIFSGRPSKAQSLCQERLWEAAKVFVDDISETKEKLVKAPSSQDWDSKLEKMRISYQGEVAEKAQSLTLDSAGTSTAWLWRKGPSHRAMRGRSEEAVGTSGGSPTFGFGPA